ncbi:hypothetical protein NL521_29390, partial [Klebsiella pneumoniae]|nr:hypothetical protein [Klebsiella pneumoniae]
AKTNVKPPSCILIALLDFFIFHRLPFYNQLVFLPWTQQLMARGLLLFCRRFATLLALQFKKAHYRVTLGIGGKAFGKRTEYL